MHYSAINQHENLNFHYNKAEPSVMSPNEDESSVGELTGVGKDGRDRHKG